jgi:hypothetical protein
MTANTKPLAHAALSQELGDYEGHWVAMLDGTVVAHAPDEESLRRHPSLREGSLLFPIGDPPSGFYLIGV